MAVTAKTFTFTGFTGTLLDSRSLAGVDIGTSTGDLWSEPLAANYYVSSLGSDTADGLTPATAFLTIKKGMQTLVGQTGKVLQVQNGTYQTTNNFISDVFHGVNISGTANARNRIQAQTVGGVTITDQGIGSLLYTHQAIKIITSKFVDVVGFYVNFTGNILPDIVCSIGGTNGRNRLARCLVRKTGNLEPFASWYHLSGSYNLMEDCYGVGGTRYGFETGGTNSTDNHLVFRRCVGRFDYSQSNQPKSAFIHYGANDGATTNHIAFLNCISVDQIGVNYGGGNSGWTYGGINIIKTADSDYFAGNIILNNEGEFGFWIDGTLHTGINNIIWDQKNNPLGAGVANNGMFVRASLDSITSVTKFTIGECDGQPIRNDAGNKWQTSHNLLNPIGQTYLLQPNAGPNTSEGATVLSRIGVSGSFYDDTNWNTITDKSLWPWVDEDLIKSKFALAIAIPSNGAGGLTSITADRTFCTGTMLDGVTPKTLTSYIWEYLGNPVPASMYPGG